MNRTAVEILLLHMLLTVLGYIAVAILCLTVPQVKADIHLFWVLSLTIFFTTIGCEWFYQGIEDFKYITVRGLIVKSISMLLLFAFVKTKDDLIYYGWYTVIGILGGNIFNFFRLRKYINKDNNRLFKSKYCKALEARITSIFIFHSYKYIPATESGSSRLHEKHFSCGVFYGSY